MNWLRRMLGSPDQRLDEDMKAEDEQDLETMMEVAYAAAAEGDYETAVGVWRPLAQQGWPRALSNLGACYSEGLGAPRDLNEAARLFRQAADAGDAVGQRNLATLHFKGEGDIPQDDAAAARLYRLAAEQGDAAAQDMLSWMLLEGQGVEPDPVEARVWAMEAAGREIATSMTRLGLIAHNALGMERDSEEAARWWYEAARRGEPDGQAMLGAALHLGAGVERDDRAALVWLLRAERAGSALSAGFIAAVRDGLSPEDTARAEAASFRSPTPEDAA